MKNHSFASPGGKKNMVENLTKKVRKRRLRMVEKLAKIHIDDAELQIEKEKF